MTKTTLHFIILFVVMTLAQVVCNNICLFGLAVPLIYIYFIIRLPVTLSPNWVMTLAFVIGLVIDIFANTQGMNALACTITAALRKPIFGLYFSHEDDLGDSIPSISTLGPAIYIKYMATTTLTFCALLFLTQAFTLHHLQITILRIVCSSVLSAILIFGIDSVVSSCGKRL